MTRLRLPRLERLFGASLDQISHAQLVSALEAEISEAIDLDFKEAYSDPKDLASDVAALANAVGGLLVYGVAEIETRATAWPGVTLYEGVQEKAEQIITDRVVPFPDFEVRPVRDPDRPDRGFMLIAVAPSPMAPHAVRSGAALDYPQRVGATTTHLSEHEVVAAYRARFAGFATAKQELGWLEGETTDELLREDGPYVIVSLLPDRRVDGRVDAAGLSAFRSDLEADKSPLIFQNGVQWLHFSVAPRVLVAHAGLHGPQNPEKLYCRLAASGSGSMAHKLLTDDRYTASGAMAISDDDVANGLLGGLRFLARHARDRAGTAGSCSVRASVYGGLTDLTLSYVGFGFRDQLGTRHVAAPVPAETVADIDGLADGGTELVSTGHRLLQDLFQHFGLAEPRQTTANGAIRPSGWSYMSRELTGWTTSAGVTLDFD
ncbi:ATP-binding protein [Frankia sp. AgB1.9]|uniref:AlbA family DNA-binding domain-containing protein n=1 Tax=unclassified Frankia TaxID=2632575 RepID=UPI00193483B7|nr:MULTISPECIES: ATP-binding protein [unclassified Frankia]MBL7487793.1 ATP-binding protein [Frankia sp. AgW1.1]MBL7553202.1 ATP-binding protein [Frankia sp. AgB1.9]MBL7622953.1 ATP-binding protein [Frankia sp. AgB1.8]